ncbi:heterokaryon incompatibility protein-domain-containing protein [Bisporella sp. PMI_857]|nr:heterokaryon incompatibility protein-domain-containing protein [Bisporella sp. PMI_857]
MPSIKHPHSCSQEKRRRSQRQSSSIGRKVHSLQLHPQRKTIATKQKGYQKLQRVNHYSPLDRQTNELRVLILHSGTEADQIQCTLKTYRLDDCPAFEALSYAWGDSELVEPVFINKSRVMVTHNLGVALRHLRYTQWSRTLWIDAVCINQANVEERNHQVFMMNQVYSAANQVLVWLGEARNHCDVAMDRLKELGESGEVPIGEKGLSRALIYDELINRDWWSRLWIVQEVVLARSTPIFICGSRWLPWDTFMKGCDVAGIEDILLENSFSANNRALNWYQLYALRKRLWSENVLQPSTEIAESLNILLDFTKDFHATDPRDKVYGCLGLVSKVEREAVSPEYQKPTQQLYLEVTKYLLQHDPYSFFSIHSVFRTGRSHGPSWVPDFSAQVTLSPCNPGLKNLGRMCSPRGQRCVSFQDSNRTLAIDGIFIDKILVTVELKDRYYRLISQIPELERLAHHAAERKLSPNDSRYCFQSLKKYEDIVQVLTGGPADDQNLRDEYDAYTRGSNSPPGAKLQYLLKRILPGRYFFITEIGFVGTAVSRVRKNDAVTVLFGERLPVVLQPRGVAYSMVCAAYVSGIMGDELTGEMYKKGLVEKKTFLIR